MRRFGRWGWIAVLAALVCCGFMALLTATRVATAVRTGTEAALDGVGLGADVSYVGIDGFDGIGRDGLNIVVEGPASAEEAALDAVRARSEIDQVTYRVIDADNAEPAQEVEPEVEEVPDPEPETEAEPAPAADLDAATVTATATGSAIDLVGVVPDEPTRDALISTAVNEFGAADVTHHLVVDAEAVTLERGHTGAHR